MSGLRYGMMSTGWRTLPFSFAEFSPDGAWTIELANGKKFDAGKNDVFFIPAGTKHRLTVPKFITSMRTFWLHLELELESGLDLLLGSESETMLKPQFSKKCRYLMMQAKDAQENTPSYSSAIRLKRISWEVAELLINLCVLPIIGKSSEIGRISSVLSHVRTHLGSKITRKDMAEIACLSPTRFHAVFKNAVGIAPIDYVLRCRIKLAQELLVNTGKTTEQIAIECGFRTSFYFSRMFSRHVGQSPSAFRKASLL